MIMHNLLGWIIQKIQTKENNFFKIFKSYSQTDFVDPFIFSEFDLDENKLSFLCIKMRYDRAGIAQSVQRLPQWRQDRSQFQAPPMPARKGGE